MSNLTGKRLAFATALSAVPDVHGYPHRPSTMTPGDAWPMLSSMPRAQGTAFNVVWRIRVLLPQDEEAASTWLDEHWDALFYALAPHGFVSQATPVMLAAGGGDMYALEITLTAEE
jgi:hypothetical protein